VLCRANELCVTFLLVQLIFEQPAGPLMSTFSSFDSMSSGRLNSVVLAAAERNVSIFRRPAPEIGASYMPSSKPPTEC
jgi:hypothetical protein